jgi:L-lactate utilization protein LutC
MTKVEELEKAVLMLEEQVATNKTMSETYQQDLELAKKQLADINKPELTGLQFDNLQEAIEEAVGNYGFDDVDNYDKEFELDYDGRVQLSNFDFINAQELVEAIVEKVNKLFVDAEEQE